VPAKLGLPAIFVACFLLVAAPVWADDAAPAPSIPASEQPASEQPAPGTSIARALDAPDPSNVAGPANASGLTPTRGPRVQILTPPPPEPSPFDPPIDGGDGRRVVYSKTNQTVWVYDENNTIIKMHRVSGRQDPRDPLPGTYRVWSRSTRTFSINDPTITWNHMIRFAKGNRDGNIGFHDIPYQYGQPVQTVDQLGQALSGGCVRQASEDAIWMWNWAQIGTVVVVTP